MQQLIHCMTMDHIILHPWRSTSQGLINLSFPGRSCKGMVKEWQNSTEYPFPSISLLSYYFFYPHLICVNVAKSITNYIVLIDSLVTNFTYILQTVCWTWCPRIFMKPTYMPSYAHMIQNVLSFGWALVNF